MGARNDEQHETNALERETGGSVKPVRSRRWALLAAMLSAAVLVSSCAPFGPVNEKPVNRLSAGDAVIALRMGKGKPKAGMPGGTSDNWIMLLDERGWGEAGRIDARYRASIVWGERGFSYGTPEQEFLMTKGGTQEIERQGRDSEEATRFVLPDGRIVVVNMSPDSLRIETIQLDGTVAHVDNPGTSGRVGQCGSRILALADTKWSPGIKEAAFEAFAAQPGGESDQPENMSAIVQLDDHDGDVPRILAAAPLDEQLAFGGGGFICEGDALMLPSVQLTSVHDSSWYGSGRGWWEGTLVLQRWDLATGQRTIIPVRDEEGNAIDVDDEHGIVEYEGIRVGDEYRLISSNGDAYAINLVTGQGRFLFSIPTETSDVAAVFQVSETGVYALEDRNKDRLVTLSYRPWDGGERREIFATAALTSYLEPKGLLSRSTRRIEAFALRPGWDGGAQ